MLKEKLVIERKAATLITVDFTAPEIVGYAMAWLKLCNVIRRLLYRNAFRILCLIMQIRLN